MIDGIMSLPLVHSKCYCPNFNVYDDYCYSFTRLNLKTRVGRERRFFFFFGGVGGGCGGWGCCLVIESSLQIARKLIVCDVNHLGKSLMKDRFFAVSC